VLQIPLFQQSIRAALSGCSRFFHSSFQPQSKLRSPPWSNCRVRACSDGPMGTSYS